MAEEIKKHVNQFKQITDAKYENGSIMLQVDGIAWFALSDEFAHNIFSQYYKNSEILPSGTLHNLFQLCDEMDSATGETKYTKAAERLKSTILSLQYSIY